MATKGTIDNVKNAGEDRVRVAITVNDSAMSGNLNKLMTAKEAKSAGFFPGDGVELDIGIKVTGKPLAPKDIASGP